MLFKRRKGGAFFDKRSRGLLQYERPYMFAVEDPNEPDNDLAKGSYNVPRVRQVTICHSFAVCSMNVAAQAPANSALKPCCPGMPDMFRPTWHTPHGLT